MKRRHCCVTVASLYYNNWYILKPPPSETMTIHEFICTLTNLCVTSRRRESCHCEGKMNDHQRPQPGAACRPLSPLHKQTIQEQEREGDVNERKWLSRKALLWYQTSCAVQWCLLACRRPDEVLCVGLCITLIGNVFSYMLVQKLFAMPPLKMQRC